MPTLLNMFVQLRTYKEPSNNKYHVYRLVNLDNNYGLKQRLTHPLLGEDSALNRKLVSPRLHHVTMYEHRQAFLLLWSVTPANKKEDQNCIVQLEQ